MSWLARLLRRERGAGLEDPPPQGDSAWDALPAPDPPGTTSAAESARPADVSERARPAPAPERAPAAGPPDAGRDRVVLIETCIHLADQVSSRSLQRRIAETLSDVGVEPFAPDGEPFDYDAHQSVGSTPTDDAAKNGLVAMTQRAGYRDGDRVIRPADVIVYEHRG